MAFVENIEVHTAYRWFLAIIWFILQLILTKTKEVLAHIFSLVLEAFESSLMGLIKFTKLCY